MAEKPTPTTEPTAPPVHVIVAEDVLAGLKKSLREKLTIQVKSSYAALCDEHGWLVRLTPRVMEANKKFLSEDELESAGLHSMTKPLHRKHHLGALVGMVGMEPGEARVAKESELEDAGLEEVIHAVEVAEKNSVAVAKAAAKSAPKGEGK
jgi:hypothetical protein